MSTFHLQCPFQPTGDQPKAIAELVSGIEQGQSHQVLLGITGSGKTFTLANVIATCQRPTLVLAPNKTLAAQLFGEFHLLFPENAVEYFVSFYDYYQPEAYIPTTDTYIEKDSAINEQIDKLRHHATRSVLSRRDVIVVASVSAIYGIGSPETYGRFRLQLTTGQTLEAKDLLIHLVNMQYRRMVNAELERGTCRWVGNRVDIYPIYDDMEAIRVTFRENTIVSLHCIDPISGFTYHEESAVHVYPASHYIVTPDVKMRAIHDIQEELTLQVRTLRELGKFVESDRLEQRTERDLEMIRHLGFCHGIENYSRHLDGRSPGSPPYTMLDYFPKDFLLIVDESHITIPQLRGMYAGDRSRKETLVQFGFRLPSALDNRPLTFAEFSARTHQAIYVSATPGPYEMQQVPSRIVEQIIRPTGLLDPEVSIFSADTQVDHLLNHIPEILKRKHRVLVLTLTKKMAETFTQFLNDMKLACAYLHADVKTLDRTKILEQFRRGDIDVLVGINLLREGIDLPEVELVAVFDADKEGFLRSEVSLIQMMGRAARNVHGKVYLYANKHTSSIQRAIAETRRRRTLQITHNTQHGIIPKSITKPLTNVLEQHLLAIGSGVTEFSHLEASDKDPAAEFITQEDWKDDQHVLKKIKTLRKEMRAAAQRLDFERAHAIKQAILQAESLLTARDHLVR